MPEDQPLEEMASGTGVDYDLTQMNGDMVYETYREEDDENLYCRLANATMEVVQ